MSDDPTKPDYRKMAEDNLVHFSPSGPDEEVRLSTLGTGLALLAIHDLLAERLPSPRSRDEVRAHQRAIDWAMVDRMYGWEPNHCCGRCRGVQSPFGMVAMIVCGTCGNKRCPKASWHGYRCTGSNEPNQKPELEEGGNQP